MMRDAATSSQLKAAFEQHNQQTRQHVARLEKVFQSIGCEPEAESCPAMRGLIKEGEEMIGAKGDNNVRDAGLIAATQRVEHYEMAACGTVRSLARHLGLTGAADILQQTLNEEGEADKKLTQIAESQANIAAPQGAEAQQSRWHA
jgi:ferritin-like metal-binding protein YciE